MKAIYVCLIFAACLSGAYSLKCYVGAAGLSVQQTCPVAASDETAACMKSGTSGVYAYSCANFKTASKPAAECKTTTTVETCYCYTDLCNSSTLVKPSLGLLLAVVSTAAYALLA